MRRALLIPSAAILIVTVTAALTGAPHSELPTAESCVADQADCPPLSPDDTGGASDATVISVPTTPSTRSQLCDDGFGVAGASPVLTHPGVAASHLILMLADFHATPCADEYLLEGAADWARRGVEDVDLRAFSQACQRVAGSAATACGKAVGVLVGSYLHNPQALARCTELPTVARIECFTTLVSRYVAEHEGERLRQSLAALCAYWPVNGYVDECGIAAAAPVFHESLTMLSDAPGISSEERMLIGGLVDFCRSVAVDPLPCRRRGLAILHSNGRSGPLESPRRAVTCSLSPESVICTGSKLSSTPS